MEVDHHRSRKRLASGSDGSSEGGTYVVHFLPTTLCESHSYLTRSLRSLLPPPLLCLPLSPCLSPVLCFSVLLLCFALLLLCVLCSVVSRKKRPRGNRITSQSSSAESVTKSSLRGADMYVNTYTKSFKPPLLFVKILSSYTISCTNMSFMNLLQ